MYCIYCSHPIGSPAENRTYCTDRCGNANRRLRSYYKDRGWPSLFKRRCDICAMEFESPYPGLQLCEAHNFQFPYDAYAHHEDEKLNAILSGYGYTAEMGDNSKIRSIVRNGNHVIDVEFLLGFWNAEIMKMFWICDPDFKIKYHILYDKNMIRFFGGEEGRRAYTSITQKAFINMLNSKNVF